ncbi:MAG: peptidoglycan editing factor PgeF [Bdellovibrionales bacterium]|jgi:YfiH family protein|nr:peptidoglycan editing factor PgeF [Bdellovibrionales bacterium]
MRFLTTDLEKIKYLRHGFFTRIGGASGGVFAGMNCAYSSGDDPEHIAMNRAKVAESLGVAEQNLLTLKQVHSARVVTVADVWTHQTAPQADALVTNQRGIAIGVLTADCAPVLFADTKNKIIGAAHAGWKGAIGGVIAATVDAMEKLGSKRADIAAAIGPCIGPMSYEVSDEFKNPFAEQSAQNEKFFRPAEKAGHLIFDLPGYTAECLRAAGVGLVHDTQQDTLPNETAFYSYRRTCQRAEKDYGRQISAIVIR